MYLGSTELIFYISLLSSGRLNASTGKCGRSMDIRPVKTLQATADVMMAITKSMYDEFFEAIPICFLLVYINTIIN